ncbi:MAG: hypothetical protein AB2556_07485 [Candidatus Thiodiazotropha sp.]
MNKKKVILRLVLPLLLIFPISAVHADKDKAQELADQAYALAGAVLSGALDADKCRPVEKHNTAMAVIANFKDYGNRCSLWLYIGGSDYNCRCAKFILGNKHQGVMSEIGAQSYGYSCDKHAYAEPAWFSAAGGAAPAANYSISNCTVY